MVVVLLSFTEPPASSFETATSPNVAVVLMVCVAPLDNVPPPNLTVRPFVSRVPLTVRSLSNLRSAPAALESVSVLPPTIFSSPPTMRPLVLEPPE